MGIVSFAWGIAAFGFVVLAFVPCLAPLDWFNLPFSSLGVLIGLAALFRAADKAIAITGFTCSAIGLGVTLVRLIFAQSTF